MPARLFSQQKHWLTLPLAYAALAFGCVPSRPSPAQMSAAQAGVNATTVRLQQADMTHRQLDTQLTGARRTLADAPRMHAHYDNAIARLRRSLPSAQAALVESQRTKRAFDEKYPDLYAAAHRYVHTYTATPAYGEAATEKAIAAALRDLQSMRQQRADAAAEFDKDVRAIRAEILDLLDRQQTLADATRAAEQTVVTAQNRLVTSQLSIAGLTKELEAAELKLNTIVEQQKRLASSEKAASEKVALRSTKNSDTQTQVAAFIFAIVCITFVAGYRQRTCSPTGMRPPPITPQPPRRQSGATYAWLGWLLAFCALLFCVYSFTPPARYPSQHWNSPEGRAIRDEQDHYDNRIPRGR